MQPSEVKNITKLDVRNLSTKSEESVDRGVLFPLNCQLNKVEILCFLNGIASRAFLNSFKFVSSRTLLHIFFCFRVWVIYQYGLSTSAGYRLVRVICRAGNRPEITVIEVVVDLSYPKYLYQCLKCFSLAETCMVQRLRF